MKFHAENKPAENSTALIEKWFPISGQKFITYLSFTTSKSTLDIKEALLSCWRHCGLTFLNTRETNQFTLAKLFNRMIREIHAMGFVPVFLSSFLFHVLCGHLHEFFDNCVKQSSRFVVGKRSSIWWWFQCRPATQCLRDYRVLEDHTNGLYDKSTFCLLRQILNIIKTIC